jgi:hypothetical protein
MQCTKCKRLTSHELTPLLIESHQSATKEPIQHLYFSSLAFIVVSECMVTTLKAVTSLGSGISPYGSITQHFRFVPSTSFGASRKNLGLVGLG